MGCIWEGIDYMFRDVCVCVFRVLCCGGVLGCVYVGGSCTRRCKLKTKKERQKPRLV